MTNTQSHAKRELEILAKTVPDAIITPFNNEILALCYDKPRTKEVIK